jgi:putative colanic acid biosynthesis glycosyltransferase
MNEIGGGLRTKGFHKESPLNLPLISVVTVVFNGKNSLEKTIQSVLNQSYKNIEYVIIDGGSTDSTQNIINKYTDVIDYWISEPDNGIYDAMNKGINAARGDWIYFLGSDDILYDNRTISDVVAYLAKEESVVFGNIMYNNGKCVKSRFNIYTLLHNTVHHQSAFYNANLFRNWSYDSGLRLIADYELNLRIYLNKMKYQQINKTIAICNQRGQSRSNLKQAFIETNLVRKKYVSGILGMILYFLYYIKFKIHSG